MAVLGVFFAIVGSLGLFLYGMKVMSDGIQQAAGQRMQKALAFMTGNRLSAVLTGCGVTAIIQSSSATTVMVVSFVNAGLLTLKQAIGVIMGANIGTTITAWFVSVIGFSLKLTALALPAIGLGFIMSMFKPIKWKQWGTTALGFGLLFLGLDFLTKSMPGLSIDSLEFIRGFSDKGFSSIVISALAGTVVTLILHSSSAATAIVLTMAYQGMITFDMAVAMIMGANIGTTVDASLAAIGAKPAAKQAALVHVLFNVLGTLLALCVFKPFVNLVIFIAPGTPEQNITGHIAMFHTMFNLTNTIIFFPFVNQLSVFVGKIIKDTGRDKELKHYTLVYSSGSLQHTPELNILRAEKEIKDMAGIVSSMYERISEELAALKKNPHKEKSVEALSAELQAKEQYADDMREALTHFLIECTRQQLNYQSERRISRLLGIVTDLENMTDDCYTVGLLLERSVKKDRVFASESMDVIAPYASTVGSFLEFVKDHLGKTLTEEEIQRAAKIEEQIDKTRNKLRKFGQKRIEAGENVKTELLFIDFVRRLERLGDYCYHISEALAHMDD